MKVERTKFGGMNYWVFDYALNPIGQFKTYKEALNYLRKNRINAHILKVKAKYFIHLGEEYLYENVG